MRSSSPVTWYSFDIVSFLNCFRICPLCHPFHSPRCKHFEYIQVFMSNGSPYIPWHCSNSFNGHQLLLCVFIFLYTLDCNLFVSSTGISISIQSFLNHYVKTFSLCFFFNLRVRTTYVTVPPALRPQANAWPRLQTSVPFRHARPLHSTSLTHFLSAFSSSTPDMLPCHTSRRRPTSPHVSSPDYRPY